MNHMSVLGIGEGSINQSHEISHSNPLATAACMIVVGIAFGDAQVRNIVSNLNQDPRMEDPLTSTLRPGIDSLCHLIRHTDIV